MINWFYGCKKSLLFSSISFRYSLNNKKSKIIFLFERKRYREIFEINPNKSIDKKQLKKKYLELVKKYHTDYQKAIPQIKNNRGDDEEIKCITVAFAILTNKNKLYETSQKTSYNQTKTYQEYYEEENEEENTNNYQQQNQMYRDMDEACMNLFSQNYKQSKQKLYSPKNDQDLNRFHEQLNRIRTLRNKYKYTTVQNQVSHKVLALIAGTVCVSFIFLFFKFIYNESNDLKPEQQSNYDRNKVIEAKKYTDQELDAIRVKTQNNIKERVQILTNKVKRKHPSCLQYPVSKDPPLLQQLIQYSIAPDIHLYEVPSNCFTNQAIKQQIRQNNVYQSKKQSLTQIKPNIALTFSLQAQRCLQNIYIPVSDIIEEIQQTGRFKPPQIFFRFYGYILFQLRQKSFSQLKNHSHQRYISLFDLYFDYYSPIFFKRDRYYDYLADYDNKLLFGLVHLNHRSLPIHYLKSGEKVVFMHNKLKQNVEEKYRQVWEGHYEYYGSQWRDFKKYRNS